VGVPFIGADGPSLSFLVVAIRHLKLKGPITLVDLKRRETMQLSMPFKR
jgi:hypothetical protein